MQKHTPGPWNYAADSLREGRFSIYANGPIAHCGDAAKPGDGEANARLIAAAPDMKLALIRLLKEHDALQMAEGSHEDRWPAATTARAILNKIDA